MSKKIKKRTSKPSEEVESTEQQAEQAASLDPSDPNSPLYDPDSPFTAEELAEVETNLPPDEFAIVQAERAQAAPKAEDAEEKEAPSVDPLDEFTFQAVGWFDKNKNTVFASMAAISVLAVLAWAGLKLQESQAVSSSAELNIALAEAQVMLDDSPDFLIFKNQEEVKQKPRTYADDKTKWDKVYQSAAASAKANAGKPIGHSSQLVQASAALRLQNWDEAISLYQAAVKADALGHLKPSISYGLGMAYWGKGDAANAVKTFEELAKQGGSFAQVATYQQALVLESSGKKDEAKNLMHKLLETYPDTSFKTDVERRLAKL
jgi:tetratricopeptide (TPR) repeat protein